MVDRVPEPEHEEGLAAGPLDGTDDAPGAEEADVGDGGGVAGPDEEVPGDDDGEALLDDEAGGEERPDDEGADEPDAPAPQGPLPIAELDQVQHSYGEIPALGPITLRLEGVCIGLLGPNGAGKTTMMRILMGLLSPTSGTARVLGEAASADTRRRIGYVPEGECRFPELTGVEAVAYAGELQGMPAADALQRAHQVLDYVGLGEARYRRADGYSTGMRQRLKLAHALVHDPELLILDEPTEGVDPMARTAILGLLDELRRVHGIRIVLSTHLLADVERIATHVMVLSAGRMVLHGRLDELQQAAEAGLAVRVAGDPEALKHRLDEAGIPWRDAHPEIHVDTTDRHAVLQHVQDAGLQVRHLAPVRMRLDDTFAQAVGGVPDA